MTADVVMSTPDSTTIACTNKFHKVSSSKLTAHDTYIVKDRSQDINAYPSEVSLPCPKRLHSLTLWCTRLTLRKSGLGELVHGGI